jgi:membrane protease YdiL (CAAX protease family)
MVMEVVKSHSRVEFMTVVFVIAVTPAICEEFLFRGLILTNLLKFLRPVLAIIFTGLIFALFHFDPFNLVPLIILGIYITIASYASNSIYTAIVLHFINNFISAMGVYVLGEEFTSSTKNVSPEEFQQLLLWGVISAILFVIILISVRKLYKSKNIISI